MLECQIEKFPTLYFETIIKREERLVLTGRLEIQQTDLIIIFKLFFCRIFFWWCVGPDGSGTVVASTPHQNRSIDVQCDLHHLWAAPHPELTTDTRCRELSGLQEQCARYQL